MKILVIGSGGVGAAVAAIAKRRSFFTGMFLTDIDSSRAVAAAKGTEDALLILITIIVLLVTVRWAEVPGLVDYITFALTVTSLALAFLAIIYSIYSNASLSQTVSSIGSSASLVSSASSEISQATDQLTRRVEAIPPLIETVGHRVEETHVLMEEVSERAWVHTRSAGWECSAASLFLAISI